MLSDDIKLSYERDVTRIKRHLIDTLNKDLACRIGIPKCVEQFFSADFSGS